jgi:hypothetical protein
MDDDLGKIKNRIWITERCHMQAEKRSRFLELYFHIVLASFALASIAVSVFNQNNLDTHKESILSFTSITTLCLSLLIFGFKFGEVAANHRSCYLELQKLRAMKSKDHLAIEQKFIEILGYYPNHTNGDYMRLAVSNVFRFDQELESPLGKKTKFSLWQRSVYVCGWLLARVSLVVFAIMPILMGLYGTDFLGAIINSQ